MLVDMFSSSLYGIERIIGMSIFFYFSLIIVLKVSGKRTLSEINAFDFLVTVTIGSIAATTIVLQESSFIDGIVAVTTLIILQYILAKLDTKYYFIGKFFLTKPTLLYYKGEYLIENMNKMRITKNDLDQQVRLNAGTLIENVSAVVLESNGGLSIITKANDKNIEKLEKFK